MSAGIAEQFGKDQHGVVDDRFRHTAGAELITHPVSCPSHARRAMGYGHA
jgi:hypothetical protein